MLSNVPCIETECIYHNDGICTLDTVKTSCNKDIEHHDCVYYQKSGVIDSENPLQNLQTF